MLKQHEDLIWINYRAFIRNRLDGSERPIEMYGPPYDPIEKRHPYSEEYNFCLIQSNIRDNKWRSKVENKNGFMETRQLLQKSEFGSKEDWDLVGEYLCLNNPMASK